MVGWLVGQGDGVFCLTHISFALRLDSRELPAASRLTNDSCERVSKEESQHSTAISSAGGKECTGQRCGALRDQRTGGDELVNQCNEYVKRACNVTLGIFTRCNGASLPTAVKMVPWPSSQALPAPRTAKINQEHGYRHLLLLQSFVVAQKQEPCAAALDTHQRAGVGIC